MLRALDLRAVQRPAVIARQPVRIFLAAQPAEDEDAARRAKMKQLFGIDEVQPYKPTRKEREEEALQRSRERHEKKKKAPSLHQASALLFANIYLLSNSPGCAHRT